MYKIFSICIFFFLSASLFAQDTTYEIHHDSLYRKITYVSTMAITHFKGAPDSLLVIQAIQGADVNNADTLSYMQGFPAGLLFSDQVIAITAMIDSVNKDGIPEIEIIHPRVHLRTLPNYYAFSGIAVMAVILFIWFLYERSNYRKKKHVPEKKTLTAVVLSICAMVIFSVASGLVLFITRGEYNIPGSIATDSVSIGITYLILCVLQFSFMAIIVQWLQNKYVLKKSVHKK